VSVFVDTSVWYAATDKADVRHQRVLEILEAGEPLITSDHVLVETWLLLNARFHHAGADRFWSGVRAGAARVESTTPSDLEVAWHIGERFPDQDFSLVDRTSFATMMRLGITRVASFDPHFAVFRYGPRNSLAFEVLR
jgi:predicted nucleic acid-binding protein